MALNLANKFVRYSYIYIYLVGGLEHGFYFSHHIGNVIIPTDFHIFQRGRSTTKQYVYIYIYKVVNQEIPI